MWTKHKLFLLQGAGSTQAVESFFRVLKQYQKQQFGNRLPSLQDFIPAIAKAIDEQFGSRQRLVQNKRITYYHADPMMHQALEQASWELNPTGMKLFFNKIEMHEKRAKHMELLDGVNVKETYNSGEKTYNVNGMSCTCSTYAQQFYCRHLVFYRVSYNLPIFDLDSFHPSLRKDSEKPQRNLDDREEVSSSPTSPGNDMIT